jgi:hypothetical protein
LIKHHKDAHSSLPFYISSWGQIATAPFMGSNEVKEITLTHSLYAYQRAELAIENKRDLELLKAECPHTKN